MVSVRLDFNTIYSSDTSDVYASHLCPIKQVRGHAIGAASVFGLPNDIMNETNHPDLSK